jgi:hypothetical protein
MKPGEHGQLSLELFPEVDAATARLELERRAAEPARVEVPPEVAAPGVTGYVLDGSALLTTRETAQLLHVHPRTVQCPVERSHAAATALLDAPDALLTRTHLRELGLERRAVDAVFRALAVVALPGYSRPMIRVRDYLELIENYTFRDDRVRPSGRVA